MLIRDSVLVERKADTIYISEIKWRERIAERRDTLLRIDTITLVERVEVPTSKSGTFSFGAGWVILVVLPFIALWIFRKLRS